MLAQRQDNNEFLAHRIGEKKQKQEAEELLEFCAIACSSQRQPLIVCRGGKVVPVVADRTREWKEIAPQFHLPTSKRRLRSALAIRTSPESSDDAVAFACGLFRAVFSTMVMNLRALLLEPHKAAATIMRSAKTVHAVYTEDPNHAASDDFYSSFAPGRLRLGTSHTRPS